MKRRPAAVAGMFYPGRRDDLESEVRAMLAAAPATDSARRPKALIVPHAGYVYSGAVAAAAYARLSPFRGELDRVVVAGPSHYVAFEGVAIPSVSAFETPLGEVPLDAELLDALAQHDPVMTSDLAHEREHSLEVQLPFLQVSLDEFALVPLAVGDIGAGAMAALLERAWGGPSTLVVISTDLSHYHEYEAANEIDERTARAVDTLGRSDIGPYEACGSRPLNGMIEAARERGLQIERLDLRNSGDTAGPRDQVVGYGAWALYETAEESAG